MLRPLTLCLHPLECAQLLRGIFQDRHTRKRGRPRSLLSIAVENARDHCTLWLELRATV